MSERPQRFLGRTLACLAVILLGLVAAAQLRLAYQPTWGLPELQVQLSLPETLEIREVARRYVVPLEAAVRAAGDVRAMGGEVDARGVSLRVRYRPGTDGERKAARLESELGTLRRLLPEDSVLDVRPFGQGSEANAALVWLPVDALGEGLEERLLDTLRLLPEVRNVELLGRGREEVRLRSRRHSVSANALAAEVARGSRTGYLGEWRAGDLRRSLRVEPFSQQLHQLPWRLGEAVVPLEAVATLELMKEDPPWVARYGGEPGPVLAIERELDASPLLLSHRVRATLADFDLEARAFFLIDEAEPLRLLLKRLGFGLGAALLAAVLLAGWLAGRWAALAFLLALPVALGGALNAYLLADLDLDLATLPMLTLALVSGLLFFALRLAGRGVAAFLTVPLAAALLPVAAALAGGRLTPLLLAPSRAYLLAVIGALVVLWLPPIPTLGSGPLPKRPARIMRTLFRNRLTVILVCATLCFAAFLLTGKALAPRAGSLPQALVDVYIFLDFPEGSTLEQAGDRVRITEEHLDTLEEVTALWSVYDARGARLGLTLREEDREPAPMHFLMAQLRAELRSLGAAARVVQYGGAGRGEAMRFDDSLDDEAEVDDEYIDYRFVMRSTDLDRLLMAHQEVIERLRGLKMLHFPGQIRTEWRPPALQLELSPRRGVPPEQASRALAHLRRGAALPSAQPIDHHTVLRVLDLDSPEHDDEVPQRHDLLGLKVGDGEPLVVSNFLAVHETVGPPGLRRQSGRFTLPVNLRLRGSIKAMRGYSLGALDRYVARVPLPLGVEIERPDLGRLAWLRDQARPLAVAGVLPLLLFVLSVIRLNSFRGALAVLASAVFGLAIACPVVLWTRGNVDEMTLLALGAAGAVFLPAALEVAAILLALRNQPLAAGAAHRWLSRWVPWILSVAVAWTLLGVVPGLGLQAEREPWLLPLRTAGWAGGAALLASCLLLPALLTLRRPPPREERQRLRRPPQWFEPGPLELEVRHLSKVYGNGFHALRAVNFHLEPGIIGLLGPNGAGKTTLLRTLCGLLEPSRGQVLFRGSPITPHNLPAYRRLVGFLPQDFNAYEGFTAEQFLDYWGLERGLDRATRKREIEHLLVQVGLEDAAGRKVRDFSGGMRRRIGIARSLLGNPPIVIVDEPTTGLDVESRNRLRESLLSVAGERIILFSTHIASDIAATASRILLLHQGRLLYDGLATGLIERAHGRVFEALVQDDDLRELSHHFRITTRVRTLEGIRVRAVTFGDQKPAGEVVAPNLEEAYLAMLGVQEGVREEFGREGGPSLLDVASWKT